MREHAGFATIAGGVLALLSPAAAAAQATPATLPLVPMPQTVTRAVHA
jgi:hexosaminidase